jgi:hypothetical protein
VATEFDYGLLVGLLIGEGHFGGDGLRPQVTLRMHVRHEALFRWLEATFPGGKLYGPYHHGGRDYYQWMVRGSYLRDVLLPLLERRMSPELDGYSFDRLRTMRRRYQAQLRRTTDETPAAPPPDRGQRPATLDEIFDELRAAWSQ